MRKIAHRPTIPEAVARFAELNVRAVADALARVADLVIADLNGYPQQAQIERELGRVSRAVEAFPGGRIPLGQSWPRFIVDSTSAIVTPLMARHGLRVEFDTDTGFWLEHAPTVTPRPAQPPHHQTA